MVNKYNKTVTCLINQKMDVAAARQRLTTIFGRVTCENVTPDGCNCRAEKYWGAPAPIGIVRR